MTNSLLGRALARLVRNNSQYGAPPSSFMRVSHYAPRQVVLLTARHNGAENVWPIDWHIPLSIDPELYGISLGREGFGKSLIQASKAFIVHFVPSSWEEIIFFCGHTSGEKVDKFAETGLVKETATTIDAPRLSEALGFIECKVVDQLEVGDHTLFVGQVTYAEERIDSTRLHHIDGNLKDLVGTFE